MSRSRIRKTNFGAWEVITPLGFAYYFDHWFQALFVGHTAAVMHEKSKRAMEDLEQRLEQAIASEDNRPAWKRWFFG